MKTFKYKKIDAFATEFSDGNPAGYILLEDDQSISEAEMLQIARQQKGFVNEVGFVRRKSDDLFELKYYSSEREVDFCGHATIAIMYDLVKTNPDLLQKTVLSIQTNRGILDVYNRVQTENAVFILSPKPEFKNKTPRSEIIAQSLNIDVNNIDTDLPIKIINAGLNTLLVPITTLDAILSINPNIDTLKSFCIQNGIDIIEVFTDKTENKNNNYRTRVFASTFGYLEDPATGSGNSALGYYLLDNNMWINDIITIEQNKERIRSNSVKLQKITDEEKNIRVLFGGGAISRIEGFYLLQ